jgi:hypothetical protein
MQFDVRADYNYSTKFGGLFMPVTDIEQRGETIFANSIRPRVTNADEGKFIVIDVTSGDYEIDSDHVKALERMLAHHGSDSLYSIRIGSPTAYKLGSARAEVTS